MLEDKNRGKDAKKDGRKEDKTGVQSGTLRNQDNQPNTLNTRPEDSARVDSQSKDRGTVGTRQTSINDNTTGTSPNRDANRDGSNRDNQDGQKPGSKKK